MSNTLLDGRQIKSGSIPTTALGGGVVSSSAQAITWTVATASFALNGGGGGAAFPYTGSAQISGSLVLVDGLVVGYLKPDAANGLVRIGADSFTIVSIDIGGQSYYQFGATNMVPVTTNIADLGTVTNKWKSVNATNLVADNLLVTSSAIISGSMQVTGSLSVSRGITGSLLGTASTAISALTSSNILGGTAGYIPLWASASVQSSSALVQAAGNIGIGVTPAGIEAKLHILSGSIQLDNTYGIRMRNNAGAVESVLNLTAGNNLSLAAPTAGGSIQYSVRSSTGTHQFLVNGVEYLRITNTGTNITGSVSISGSTGLTVTGSASFANDVIMNGVVRNRLNLSTQTTNYTLTLADEGRLIFMASGGLNVVTVPSSSTANFPIGSQIMLTQSGSGQTSFASASNQVTLLSANNAFKLANRYSAATLVKTNIDTWYLFGDIVI